MSDTPDFDDIITISSEPVELYKILKLAQVATGGEAKMLIAEGYVAHNMELETRKRKKVYGGDTVQFDQQLWLIKLAEGAARAERPVEPSPAPAPSIHTPRKKKARPKLS
jgi:ribosome-associated protein